jgi:hypothetical protein
MGGLLEKLTVAEVTFRLPTFYGIQKVLLHRSLPLGPLLSQMNYINAVPHTF